MFGSEAATEITLPELRQPFCFCSGNSAVEGDEEEIYLSTTKSKTKIISYMHAKNAIAEIPSNILYGVF